MWLSIIITPPLENKKGYISAKKLQTIQLILYSICINPFSEQSLILGPGEFEKLLEDLYSIKYVNLYWFFVPRGLGEGGHTSWVLAKEDIPHGSWRRRTYLIGLGEGGHFLPIIGEVVRGSKVSIKIASAAKNAQFLTPISKLRLNRKPCLDSRPSSL